MTTINLAEDFSRYPAGRNLTDGPYSGEKFRVEFLEPALNAGEEIEILMDGARGHGSSFLEEAFGGLIRAGFEKSLVLNNIQIVSKDDSLKIEVNSYIDEAQLDDNDMDIAL